MRYTRRKDTVTAIGHILQTANLWILCVVGNNYERNRLIFAPPSNVYPALCILKYGIFQSSNALLLCGLFNESLHVFTKL